MSTVLRVRRPSPGDVFGGLLLAIQTACIIGFLLLVTVGIGTAVYHWFSPAPAKPADVCWVAQGPNGIQTVRGPRSYEPRDAVEVPC